MRISLTSLGVDFTYVAVKSSMSMKQKISEVCRLLQWQSE